VARQCIPGRGCVGHRAWRRLRQAADPERKLVGLLSTSSILPPGDRSDFTRYYNHHTSIAGNLSWITSIS
jgi:hypothetical protein